MSKTDQSPLERWYRRTSAEIEERRARAEQAGRDAYNRATRLGQNLVAPTIKALEAIGRSELQARQRQVQQTEAVARRLIGAAQAVRGESPTAANLGLRGSQPAPAAPGVRLGPLGSGAEIEYKPDAGVDQLRPEITRTYPAIVNGWRSANGPRPVITAGNDGSPLHRADTRHGQNLALDLRGNNLTARQATAIRDYLSERLGTDYDVLYETYPDTRRNHIHLEYDPD